MASDPRGHALVRPGRAGVAMSVALLLATGTGPVAAQSPSGSAGVWVSPAPWDVSALRWTRSEVIDGSGEQTVVDDLAAGADGRILIVGGVLGEGSPTAAAWASSDGLAWTRLAGELPDGSVAVDALATDDGFLVVTRSDTAGLGRLFRTDGITLVPLDAPSGDLSELGRSPAGLHALGGDDAPTVWTSTDDGTTWVPAVVTTEDAVASHLALADDGTIVVLGWLQEDDDLRVATAWSSADGGATWTAARLPLDPDTWLATDLARTPIGLMARVVDPMTSEVQGVDLRSTDGVTWDAVLVSPGWGSVGTAGSEAIVFGTDAAWHSPDGRTWTEERWPTLNGFDIVASDVMPDGRVVAVGQGSAPSAPASFVGTQSPPGGPSAAPSPAAPSAAASVPPGPSSR